MTAVDGVYAAGSALCDPFLSALPATGLSITVVTENGAQSTIGTSDLVAARLEELQFQLGEGPTSDVLRSGRPALAPDLHAAPVLHAWPVFGPEAFSAGARGLFTFPLLVGPMRVGVVSLYASMLRPLWSDADLRTATALADAAARPAIDLATRSAEIDVPSPGPRQTEMRREVHQAAGMLSVQLGCGIDEAMGRLRAHAYAVDQPIDVVARDVVTRDLDLATLED